MFFFCYFVSKQCGAHIKPKTVQFNPLEATVSANNRGLLLKLVSRFGEFSSPIGSGLGRFLYLYFYSNGYFSYSYFFKNQVRQLLPDNYAYQISRIADTVIASLYNNI